jgi:transcriptional regulator with XRE-family HTH domain
LSYVTKYPRCHLSRSIAIEYSKVKPANSPLPTSYAIGERISSLRINKGWSRRQLARLAGLTLPALDRLEKGTVNRVDLYKLEKVSDSLSITLSELIGLKGPGDVRAEVALNLLYMRSEHELNGVVRSLRRGLSQMEPAISGVSINLFRQGSLGCYFSVGDESGYFNNAVSMPDARPCAEDRSLRALGRGNRPQTNRRRGDADAHGGGDGHGNSGRYGGATGPDE